ncbi:ABC transporter ATP-binding protein [Nitratireductor sp. GZWM139]|uniref:ABC transporter ATP-binding protein n=1 Tax=Nitratireductor sp. GZWM139 TaxID=2950541 RepID=UPI0024BEBC3E|nr:ABC transporter ATP-binding protein [Nitratireductor sp. GZWM139]MDJ1466145.1 ABC transporter ATP-binding protein [Nitratireductor sp. GZWM139]
MTTIKGASVRCENLQKAFGTVKAVDDVSFDISGGEFITLLGPSGSGKTTTLMMIAGFEVPTGGDILINDTSVATVQPRSRNIGMIFQNYALFPHMSVYQNVAFPLRMRGRDEEETRRRVRVALETVGLTGYDSRFPRQLSGGQQQRVAFARAIVFDAPLLLMDEPLGALDKQLRQKLQIEVKRIQRDLGVTVIYVTHDQEEALVMSDRVILMNEARIAQMGTPSDLYDRPVDSFVASFLGESNMLEGKIEQVSANEGSMMLNGNKMVGQLAGQFSAGDDALIVVRPEKMWFADDENDGRTNRLSGRVIEAIYVGDHHRVVVGLDGREPLIVKHPTQFGQRQVSPGETVELAWHPADTRILRAPVS